MLIFSIVVDLLRSSPFLLYCSLLISILLQELLDFSPFFFLVLYFFPFFPVVCFYVEEPQGWDDSKPGRSLARFCVAVEVGPLESNGCKERERERHTNIYM